MPLNAYSQYQDTLITINKKSQADAKGNTRQQCVFEGPGQTKSKLADRSNWH